MYNTTLSDKLYKPIKVNVEDIKIDLQNEVIQNKITGSNIINISSESTAMELQNSINKKKRVSVGTTVIDFGYGLNIPEERAPITGGLDAGRLIFEEIKNHGRQTVEELMRHISAIDEKLLLVVINIMAKEMFIELWNEKEINEKTGEIKQLRTLELVDKYDRVKRFKKMGVTISPYPEDVIAEERKKERKKSGKSPQSVSFETFSNKDLL